jgi:hypothetical protein
MFTPLTLVIRAVLDTNVLISTLLFSGLPSRLVTAGQSVQFQPEVSRSILDENLRALAYPKGALKKAASGVLAAWPCSRIPSYAPPVQVAAALLDGPF